MSIVVNLEATASVVETLSSATAPGASNRVLSHTAYNVSVAGLNATSTPPVSVNHQKLYTGATGTIDLTALTTADGTADATGKKLQAVRIRNLSETDDFVLGEGAANGYPLPTIRVKPGGFALHYMPEALADVAAGDKNLDYTFAAAEEAQVTLILG